MRNYIVLFLLVFPFLASFSQSNIRYDVEPGIEKIQADYVSNWKKIGTVNGFRIQVAAFSGVNSRTQAESVKNALNNTMLNQKAYVVYNEPYFRVQFGDYFSRLQAYRDLVKLKESYPGAYIVPEKINY